MKALGTRFRCMKTAFKEWAVICRALGSASQRGRSGRWLGNAGWPDSCVSSHPKFAPETPTVTEPWIRWTADSGSAASAAQWVRAMPTATPRTKTGTAWSTRWMRATSWRAWAPATNSRLVDARLSRASKSRPAGMCRTALSASTAHPGVANSGTRARSGAWGG